MRKGRVGVRGSGKGGQDPARESGRDPDPWQFSVILGAAPPADLLPNKIRRGAWADHYTAAGKVREDTYKECINQRPLHALTRSDRLHLQLHVGWPKGVPTRPDLDNTVGACKHHIDGIFDALDASDSQIDELTITASLFKEHGQGQGFIRATFTVYPHG